MLDSLTGDPGFKPSHGHKLFFALNKFMKNILERIRSAEQPQSQSQFQNETHHRLNDTNYYDWILYEISHCIRWLCCWLFKITFGQFLSVVAGLQVVISFFLICQSSNKGCISPSKDLKLGRVRIWGTTKIMTRPDLALEAIWRPKWPPNYFSENQWN